MNHYTGNITPGKITDKLQLSSPYPSDSIKNKPF